MIQNKSSIYPQTHTSFTNVTLKIRNTAEVCFNSTEYSFTYTPGELDVYTFLGGEVELMVQTDQTYTYSGIEIKVLNISSDYISDYIVIQVWPTVQNYPASLHYTVVNVTLDATKAVNISSGLINKTNQYWFTYTLVTYPTFTDALLTVWNASHANASLEMPICGVSRYRVPNNLGIEVDVSEIESSYMIVYVKPLY